MECGNQISVAIKH